MSRYALLFLLLSCLIGCKDADPSVGLAEDADSRSTRQDTVERVEDLWRQGADRWEADLVDLLPLDVMPTTDLMPSDSLGDSVANEGLSPDGTTEDIETISMANGIGEACINDQDCLEGVCVGTSLATICLPICDDGVCPYGWPCSGGETPVCLPQFDVACVPCEQGVCPQSWCRATGDEGDQCLNPCIEDYECPLEFSCLVDEDGGIGVCQPDNGSCFCREADMDGWIPCARTNDHGTCQGNAMCVPDSGRQECQADIPEPELCDSIDNDCDGQVDEDWPLKGKGCDGPDDDLCHKGKFVCAGDGLSLECANDTSYVEKCNDQDDDCDGEVDEDFPNKGKPCGVSPLCGTGTFVCSPLGLKTVCDGVKPTMETCDGFDNDCDGLVDEGFKDSDGDGVADCVD